MALLSQRLHHAHAERTRKSKLYTHCVCRVSRAILPVMVGSTRSENRKVKEQEKVLEENMVSISGYFQ